MAIILWNHLERLFTKTVYCICMAVKQELRETYFFSDFANRLAVWLSKLLHVTDLYSIRSSFFTMRVPRSPFQCIWFSPLIVIPRLANSGTTRSFVSRWYFPPATWWKNNGSPSEFVCSMPVCATVPSCKWYTWIWIIWIFDSEFEFGLALTYSKSRWLCW